VQGLRMAGKSPWTIRIFYGLHPIHFTKFTRLR
jgi:hypothetical protein